MSVSLLITWADGKLEEVPISSLRGAKWWAEIGRRLGLELLQHIHSIIPVEPGNLEQLIREFGVFRDAVNTEFPNASDTIQTVDKVLDALARLKRATAGWDASFG